MFKNKPYNRAHTRQYVKKCKEIANTMEKYIIKLEREFCNEVYIVQASMETYWDNAVLWKTDNFREICYAYHNEHKNVKLGVEAIRISRCKKNYELCYSFVFNRQLIQIYSDQFKCIAEE
jgi:hypothetical protein